MHCLKLELPNRSFRQFHKARGSAVPQGLKARIQEVTFESLSDKLKLITTYSDNNLGRTPKDIQISLRDQLRHPDYRQQTQLNHKPMPDDIVEDSEDENGPNPRSDDNASDIYCNGEDDEDDDTKGNSSDEGDDYEGNNNDEGHNYEISGDNEDNNYKDGGDIEDEFEDSLTDLAPGDNITFDIPLPPDLGKKFFTLLCIKTNCMLPRWIEIDEASPSEDEAAAQAALRLPEAQGLIHAIWVIASEWQGYADPHG